MASGLSCGFAMTTAAPILSVPNSAPTNPGPSGRAIITRCSGSTPLAGEHGRPIALPFTHAGVEDVVGDVELLGRLEGHRDRYRPWTAGGQPPRPVRYSHPMAVLDLAHLTWEEVRDLDRTKTVAIVPVGAVEAHGPHLPLATDVIIAEAMARAAAARLAARGHEAVLLPAIAYTAAEFA